MIVFYFSVRENELGMLRAGLEIFRVGSIF